MTPKINLPNCLTFYVPSISAYGNTLIVYHEVFNQECYAKSGFEIRSTDTIVDIGGNMGFFALWAATQAPAGCIVSVEPTPAIDCLLDNIQHNSLSNVKALRAAIGRDGDEIELHYHPSYSSMSHNTKFKHSHFLRIISRFASFFFSNRNAGVIIKSKCISLKRLLENYNIDRLNLLKLDCEGAEYNIFKNLDTEDLQRIDKIVMEFHELHPEHNHCQLVAKLEQNNFQVEVYKNPLRYQLGKVGFIWARKRNL